MFLEHYTTHQDAHILAGEYECEYMYKCLERAVFHRSSQQTETCHYAIKVEMAINFPGH